MSIPDSSEFIRANLPLLPVPGVPGIVLHQAVPTSGLGRLAAADAAFGSPYWAYRWAGGLALARHVLDHPGTVAGRRVLDLGAGGGLVAIAAAKAGAATVTAAEVDGYAVVALELNLAANGVMAEVGHDDLTAGDPPDVEVVLVGDLFYDEALAIRVLAFLDRCRAQGATVLIGDPRRTFLPVERLSVLAEYEVAETGTIPGKPSAVFALAGP